LLRKQLDRLYQNSRGLSEGIDPAITNGYLMSTLIEKSGARIRALLRGYPTCYLGRNTKLRGKSQLKVGSHVVIGENVTLMAHSMMGIHLDDRVTIDSGAVLRATAVIRNLGTGIRVGARTAIGSNNMLLGQGGIDIGRDCLLGPNVTIMSENHKFDRTDVPIREQGETRSPTTIGDGVWIGASAVILAGVRVGDGAIVAAGAVVTKDVEPLAIVAGVPARFVKSRVGAIR
jgi:acetyltransferase-like isoleucine patch superfamily enzyme